MWTLLLFLACAHEPAPASVPAEGANPPATTAPAAGSTLILGEADANGNETVLSPGATTTDPAALYAGCRARVEGVETDGECKVDADCARAGCSQEVCVPASVAVNVTTLCDVQPCFAVLDACGCVSGHCSWSLKQAL